MASDGISVNIMRLCTKLCPGVCSTVLKCKKKHSKVDMILNTLSPVSTVSISDITLNVGWNITPIPVMTGYITSTQITDCIG